MCFVILLKEQQTYQKHDHSKIYLFFPISCKNKRGYMWVAQIGKYISTWIISRVVLLLTRRSVKRMIDVISKPSCKSPVIQAVLKNREFFFVLVQSSRLVFTARTTDSNELGWFFKLLIIQRKMTVLSVVRWEQTTGDYRKDIVLIQ